MLWAFLCDLCDLCASAAKVVRRRRSVAAAPRWDLVRPRLSELVLLVLLGVAAVLAGLCACGIGSRLAVALFAIAATST